MFRSSTIIRELVQSLAKMLPHLHTIYDDIILLNVLTEIYL